MKNSDSFKTFKALVKPLLPGYIALFDLAALKQFNHYLGHMNGDVEIRTFDEILRAALGNDGTCFPMGSGKWCAFVADSRLDLLNRAVEKFIRVPDQAAESGWTCEALASDGSKAILKITSAISVRRGVRCGYTKLPAIEVLETKLDEIETSIRFLPVNSVRDISDVAKCSPSWSRVTGVLVQVPYYCPFCRATDIEWKDGADDGGWGFCDNCRARLDFAIA